MKTIVFVAALLTLSSAASAASCGGSAVLEAPVRTAPFGAIAGSDPCTVFVSFIGDNGSVAAYRREGDKLVLLSSVPRKGFGAMVLSHDGKLLIAPDHNGVLFIDSQRLIANASEALLATLDDDGKDADYVAVTPDDRTLFISNESSRNISVVDLAKARATGFGQESLIGTIRVGDSPVGLAISPDGGTLFATVQVLPLKDTPVTCKSETGKSGNLHPEGALLAIDVERARSDPAHAVVDGAFAGCNPVRVALSPSGDRAYVTARGSDALLVFDTQKLLAHGTHSALATIAVGVAPVGVAVSKDGAKIFVGSSNRFAADKEARQDVTVLAAANLTASNAVLGTIAVGAFPREITVTPDGSTLLVANAFSNSLSIIDLSAENKSVP